MVIKNKFSRKEGKQLVQQISNLTVVEKFLTARSIEEIKKLIANNSIFIALGTNNQIKGFIVKEKLTLNYYEIKCWYVTPFFRKKGLASKLLEIATRDSRHNYIGVTFQDKVVQKSKNLGFKPISHTKLPPKVLLAYIFTRKPTSILKNLFRKKAVLLFKKCA